MPIICVLKFIHSVNDGRSDSSKNHFKMWYSINHSLSINKLLKVFQLIKITSGFTNSNKCNYELSRIMSGKEIGDKKFFSHWGKVGWDWAEVMLSGRLFQMVGLFCSLAIVDPRVGHTMDVLSPFISVLCHSAWLFHGESCPRIDVVHPSGCAWSSSPACTWHCSLHYLFLRATAVSSWCDHSILASLLWQYVTVPSLLHLCYEPRPTHLFSLMSTKPAVSQIATHILCILSSTVSPPSLNSFAAWDLIRTCGFATCCLTDGTSNIWTKWWRLLLSIFLFSSSPFFIMVQIFTTPFPPACHLCSVSQIFASSWLDALQTWLELSSHGFDYLEELPGISFWVCCFQFHAHAFQLLLFIHCDLSLYISLHFLILVRMFAFCFSLFPDCCESLIRYPLSPKITPFQLHLGLYYVLMIMSSLLLSVLCVRVPVHDAFWGFTTSADFR